MRKIIITVVIFFFIASPCFADFRFAVMGDTRGYGRDGINIKVMKAILEKIKQEKPDLIVVTGDMITGSTKSGIHRNRLRKWKNVIERYRIPFYVVIGNHEIESEMSENIIRSVFEMPENGPAGLKELAYSFDYRNAHLVMLDTDIFNNFHTIGEKQSAWFKDDLEKNRNGVIFIFGHEPAYPVYNHIGSSLDKSAVERDELWSVFKKHKVGAYFCGHEHLYSRAMHDGIYQIITGGGGAPISAPEEKGGFYNFVIVDVKDNGAVDITVKDINGSIRDTFNIEY